MSGRYHSHHLYRRNPKDIWIALIISLFLTIFILLVIYYSKRKKNDYEIETLENCINSDDSCSICIDDFKTGDAVTLKCGHTFHKECITKWFFINNNRNCDSKCPNCNFVFYKFKN